MRAQTVVKIGIVLAVLVALLTVGAVIALKSIDLERVKDMLTTQVKTATGRTLTIAGPLELNLGLTPSVSAKGVSLSNPAGSTRPEMVKLDHFDMEIALMPLFSREIVVNRLILAAPDILIETEAKGPGNLDFTPPGGRSEPKAGEAKTEAAPPGQPAYRLVVNEVQISKGRLAWHDRTTKQTETVAIDSLTLQRDDATADRLKLRLLTTARNQAIDLQGTVGTMDGVQAGKPWPVNLQARVQGITLQVEGSIDDLSQFKGMAFTLKGQGAELIEAIRLAGVDKPELPQSAGPFSVSATLSDAGQQLQLTDLAVEAGKAELLLLTAKGTIKDLTGKAVIDLSVEATSNDPAGAAKIAGVDYTGKGPVRIATRLQGQSKATAWKMSDLKAVAGGSDVGGELTIHLADRPKVAGKLTATTIDLADFSAATPPSGPGGGPARQAAATKGDGRIFPDDPLPLDALRAVDADLTLQAGKLVLDDRQLSDVTITLTLNNGRLTVNPFRFGLAGGTFDGNTVVDGGAKPPTLALRLNGRQVELGQLDSKGHIIGGKSDISVNLTASGGSIRALMATAGGETTVSVGEGRLRNKSLDLAGGDLLFQVLGAINPLAKREETTQMHCAVVRFVIRDGIATADKGIALRTNQVDVVGSGTVNLRTEGLDLGIRPRARSGVGLSLSTPLAGLVRVSGTIAKPSMGIDAAGTLRTAASLGAGIATGGLSTVGELLVDKVTGDEDPCRTALGLPQQGGQAKPSTESQPQSPTRLLRGVFGR